MLHLLNDGALMKNIYETYTEAYRKNFSHIYLEESDAVKIILATFLYRLDNDNVPYNLIIASEERLKKVKKIRKILSSYDEVDRDVFLKL